MQTRLMARRERDDHDDKSPMPERAEGQVVKRRRMASPPLSPKSAMKKRINNAVLQVCPIDLGTALAIHTRQSAQLEFDMYEVQEMYYDLLLPDIDKWIYQQDELKECIRILRLHFGLPYNIKEFIQDTPQYDDLFSVLIEGDEMTTLKLEKLAYTAMICERDMMLGAIIRHHNFKINLEPSFTPPTMHPMKRRPLHFALKMNGPETEVVDVLLAHPDIDPSTRSVVGNVWVTALGTAHMAFTHAPPGGDKKKRAAQNVRTLLARDDVDIHSLDDRRRARVEDFDLFGAIMHNAVNAGLVVNADVE